MKKEGPISKATVHKDNTNNQHTINCTTKWGWAVRSLTPNECIFVERVAGHTPRIGDVVVSRILEIGKHKRSYLSDRRFSRLYAGDTIIGVLGCRYATDAFHAPSIDLKNLHLLTNSGLSGTVKNRHASIKRPTRLQFLGFLGDKKTGRPVNMINLHFHPRLLSTAKYVPVILTVGTGMNSGKTTVTAQVGHALASRGHRVALLKLTGSVTQRDLHEFDSTGAIFVQDFSKYGFPSTYMLEEECLFDLFQTMIMDAHDSRPDIIIAEIADGVLQRETQMLLQCSLVSRNVQGILLSAYCAPSGIMLKGELNRLGYSNLAISGKITNAPLFVEELRDRVDIPALDCFAEGEKLADQVLSWSTNSIEQGNLIHLREAIIQKAVVQEFAPYAALSHEG